MTKILAICLVLILISFSERAFAAPGRSYNSRESCINKITTVAECFVSVPSEEFTLLRSLPNANGKAIGSVSKGAEVFINDQQDHWVFVQSKETFEGKTYQTDGGWILRSALTNCRDDRKQF